MNDNELVHAIARELALMLCADRAKPKPPVNKEKAKEQLAIMRRAECPRS